MNKIYSNQKEDYIASESSGNDVENKFIDSIVELVIKALNISFHEERIVSSLLKNVIKNKIDSHYPKDNQGLLQQYEEYILDKSSEKLIKTLNLSSKINHEHAIHAKFVDIIHEIQGMLKNEKGN